MKTLLLFMLLTMQKMKKTLLLLLIMTTCFFSALAQDSYPDQIDPKSADKVFEKITVLFNNVSVLGDAFISDEKKEVCLAPTLNLFLGKGEEYYWVEDHYPPVSVYIGTDDNDTNPREVPIKTFLNNASRFNVNVSLVAFEVAQIIDIHEEDSHPWGTAIFYLCYIGENEHWYISRNYNRKPVKMDVERSEAGWEDVLLGSIVVVGSPAGK